MKINVLGVAIKGKSNKKSNNNNPVSKEFETMDKKNLRLFTSNDNIERDWFIEYYEYRNGVKIRKQFKGGINRGKTVDERKEIAAQLMFKIENDLSAKSVTTHNKNTLKAILTKSLDNQCEYSKRKKTRSSYQSKLNKLFNWCEQHKIFYPYQLNSEKVKDFFNFLKFKENLHDTTLEDYRVRLKTLGKQLPTNPFLEIKPYPIHTTPARPYQSHEIIKLKEYISEHDPQLWLFIQFITYCLIRPNSELRLLKIEHIDFENSNLFIPGEISKNKKSQWVKIPTILREEIEQLKDYPVNNFIFGKNGEPGDKALGYNAFYNRHRAILDTLGMYAKGKNQYSYKHFGAVSMARGKVPLMELKSQGRWHSLDQMLDYLEDFGVNDLHTIERIELM